MDNYFTGEESNIKKWIDHPNFEIIKHDVIEPIEFDKEIDSIWHLASPASPVHYKSNPIKTSKTIFLGTYNLLKLSREVGAKFLLASTSEIYGDPEINPQDENYKGSVNTTGIRSCYDEGKRIAETLCSDYKRVYDLDVKIMRIFNTYGPRMRSNDGRVISNFIFQALEGKPLTIYGDGNQTRSFCYVDDLIEGMINLMNSNINTPINIGNPEEFKIIQLAKKIKDIINPDLKLIYKPLHERTCIPASFLLRTSSCRQRKRNQRQRIDIYAGYSGKTTHFLRDSVIQETPRKKAVSIDGACAAMGFTQGTFGSR